MAVRLMLPVTVKLYGLASETSSPVEVKVQLTNLYPVSAEAVNVAVEL